MVLNSFMLRCFRKLPNATSDGVEGHPAGRWLLVCVPEDPWRPEMIISSHRAGGRCTLLIGLEEGGRELLVCSERLRFESLAPPPADRGMQHGETRHDQLKDSKVVRPAWAMRQRPSCRAALSVCYKARLWCDSDSGAPKQVPRKSIDTHLPPADPFLAPSWTFKSFFTCCISEGNTGSPLI